MFQKYRKNVFSQNGEDGVLLEILRRLKLKSKNKWCCEFGAWDGTHGSNTFNLVKNFDYNAVYIEGNKKRYKDLVSTSKKFTKIVCFNKYVNHKRKSANSLEKILKKTNIIKNFDVLSIDIDSFDLAVWKSLKSYRPKIVVIEINSGIIPGVKQMHSSSKIGNSFTSTLNFASETKYQLVCHTGNCIFVEKKYVKKINVKKIFFNNKNADLLFDYSWINKKDFFLKKIIKNFLPTNVIEFLRKVKKILIRLI